MAAVLLVILKTVGIILLIIVLAVIALLACVMLIPVQYGASGDIEDGKYQIKVSWLFRILQFRMDIRDKDMHMGIWIFWRQTGLLDSEKREQRNRKKEKRQARKQQRKQKKYVKEREKQKKKTDLPKRKTAETEVKIRIDGEDPQKETKQTEKIKINPRKKEKRIRIKPDLGGMSQTIRKVTDLLKEVKDKNIIGIVLPALKDMLYHLRPRKMEGNLIFGFKDPSVTGRVLGMLSWVFFLYQFEKFVLTPDFETDQTYIKGNFQVSGHFRLIHLPVFAFRIIRRKEFRTFIKSLRHSK